MPAPRQRTVQLNVLQPWLLLLLRAKPDHGYELRRRPFRVSRYTRRRGPASDASHADRTMPRSSRSRSAR